MFKIHKISCFVLLILILLMAACQKENGTDSEQIIKLGALLPLTGSGSSPGESINAAIGIALLDINRYLTEVKAGFHLEIFIEDTQSDSLTTIQKYNHLKDQGIRIIIGPCISAEVDAVKPFADQDGILIVSPASVATSLSVPDDNIFRLVPDMVGQAEAITALLNDDSIEVIVPVIRDDLWGNELLAATTQQFLQSGKEVMGAIKYLPSETDFVSVVTILSNKVNEALQVHPPEHIGVYLLCYDEGTEILHLSSSVNSLDAIRWYGSTAYAENKSLPEDLDAALLAIYVNLACPVFGYDLNAKVKWEPLLNALQVELGRKPEIYAFVAYDALWLATLAYQSTGKDPDISSLKEAFVVQSNNYYGVTGWTTLNDAGDRAFSIYDFWGIKWLLNAPEWQIVARYNNATKVLERY